MTILVLVALAIWIATLVGRMNRADLRIEAIEQMAREARSKADAVAALTARVAALEAAARPAPIAAPAPSAALPAAIAVPVSRSPAASPPPPPVSAIPVAPAEAPAPTQAQDEAWEVTVGGNWLNKIGVLVFVIGLALLVGYSMTHVDPAGRVAIGFAVSLTMLATGVVLERRAEYRTYAHGLVAGGWAGVYFTTYAMRAVDAARVINNDLTAIVLLSAVAAAMVWHSLKYRSQEVTALAYIVAYATLALTPLRGFSLAASVPLAVSVLVVAQRFSWPRIQILGILGTYGLYIMRGPQFGFGGIDTASYTPYLALAAYWLVFEVADLSAVRGRQANGVPPPPMFLLNAAGLVGSGLLQLPMDTPLPLSGFLAVSGVAYLGSALIRARLTGRPSDETDTLDGAMRGSYHGAAALAVAFVTWAIELRFAGTRRVMALLMEAQLVFLSGLILRDWVTRSIGSAVAVLVSVHTIVLIGGSGPLPWTWTTQGPAGVAALTAVLWYANREWLRSRQIPIIRHEWLYTPAATYLVVLIARAELETGYSSLAALMFAFVLVEGGLRLGREYRLQAYVVGTVSALVLLAWCGGEVYTATPSTREAWINMMAAMVVAYGAAWRLAPARGSSSPDRFERGAASAASGAFGTAFVIMLQWKVIPPEFVSLAWAATATTLGLAGLYWKLGGLRWQVYPVLGLALLRAIKPVLASGSATSVEITSALVVIGLLYGFSLAVRAALTHATKAVNDVEDAVRIVMSIAATLSLAALIYVQVRPTLVTVTWGVQAAVLLATGFPARERLLRLSGLAVLLACITRLFVFDLPQLEELARIISFVALGAVLLAVSWIYTRYRARIQKYL